IRDFHVTGVQTCALPISQLRIKVRQRLVEQEDLRPANDRPPHSDALALAARKLARLAVQKMRDPQRFSCLLDAAVNFMARVISSSEERRVGKERRTR